MIVFVTLFLGLVFGPQSISLSVGDEVDRVAILVDGHRVADLDGAPWSLEWNFGEDLAPHELEAVAFDIEGEEVGRARQWLNLPREPAEAAIVVRGGEKGKGRTAQLTWESLAGSEPESVSVVFDQMPLDFDDPSSIVLPPHDPEELHFIRTELDFGNNVSSSAEFTFGGSYLDAVSSELTAVPVVLEGRRKLPPPATIAGWFEAHSGKPNVVAVEKGPAEVILVRDPSSVVDLRNIRAVEFSKPLPGSMWRRSVPFASQDWTLQFIWPVSRSQLGSQAPFELFAHSEPLRNEAGSLIRWITEIEPPVELAGPQRLADAVAVAGVTAASQSRRRAVVLILGGGTSDDSTLSPEHVTRYLQRLRTPLFVWTTQSPDNSVTGWGQSTEISSPELLEKAVKDLFKYLDRQRIVWLTGYHLPHHVQVTPAAEGVRMAD